MTGIFERASFLFLDGATLLLSDFLLQRLERDGKDSSDPLNRQIYDAMRQAILRGEWAANTKLQSSRSLADDTGLSRNTVLHAYQQLLAEGYITSRAGSGTFVSDTLPGQIPGRSRVAAAQPQPAEGPGLSRRGALVLREAGIVGSPAGAFALGMSDTTAFPHATWARMIGRRWRYPPEELLNYAHHGGYLPLRQALAEHLRLSRSVNCDAEQVLITTSIQQSIGLIAQMLADVGDTVWLEEPGYRASRNLLRASGLQPVPIRVDEEGMAPQEADLKQPPRLMYVTPSHQFPLGMVMGLSRRRMLLEYARQRNVWILEDDYDSEFRFEGRPLASLQGLDAHGRVIYMGSLSKTLFPGVRTGYVVLPKALAASCADGFAELYREGQLVQQAALADFISEGHYAAHIRRVRQRYAHKQALLRAAIVERFGAAWPISTHEAGLHLTLHLPPQDGRSYDDVAICSEAGAQGVVARPLSRHYLDARHATQGLLLGYAGVQPEEIRPAFDKLAAIIERSARRR